MLFTTKSFRFSYETVAYLLIWDYLLLAVASIVYFFLDLAVVFLLLHLSSCWILCFHFGAGSDPNLASSLMQLLFRLLFASGVVVAPAILVLRLLLLLQPFVLLLLFCNLLFQSSTFFLVVADCILILVFFS